MKEALSFDDVNIVPSDWFNLTSRSVVDTRTAMCGTIYNLGIVSSNMDTVYSPTLARATAKAGGVSCVHRFCSVEENVKLFKDGISDIKPWVSIGVGQKELERAMALVEAGAETIVIDVANGANNQVLAQYNALREAYGVNVAICVGNFATSDQIKTFLYKNGTKYKPDLFKVSIGSGSACTTRLNTGIGVPSFTCLQDCVSTQQPIIFDGGIKNGGDFAKAMALGARGVMMGRNFAACEESPGNLVSDYSSGIPPKQYKKYRGSASQESYEAQGKVASHRGPEGEAFLVEVTGTVAEMMQKYDGWLRSTMTQVDASNLKELKENAVFIRVTNSGFYEGGPHGKK